MTETQIQEVADLMQAREDMVKLKDVPEGSWVALPGGALAKVIRGQRTKYGHVVLSYMVTAHPPFERKGGLKVRVIPE